MKMFFTPSVGHLEPYIPGERGNYKLRKFNDGELFLKLEDDVENQPVTVITATPPPTKNFSELFFLLDTLKQQKAQTHVIFTYFGYARQDHPKPNVARAAHIICNCLKQFDIHKSTIIHPHSAQLQQDISYDRFVPYQLYAPLVKELDIDTIVSPDTGGILACQELAQQTHCQIGSIEKERNANDQIITTVDAINLPSKLTRVLIFDDIVSTGATIINAATILKEHGALTIYALVTHCFMNEITMQKLTESPVQHLWVTNSVPIHTKSSHITVINLAPAITTIIRGTFAI